MLSQKIERLLDQVSKPARYSGGELNTVVKDPGAVQARFAFCFPDAYEVGMSHLGIKILYHAINQRPEYACERVFAPWPDMEALMRENDVPLFSLETRCPVREFDFVGFTLQYEMSYTNILNMLDLAGIPLLSADRTEGPFVVAGGPCACNPETLADFIDVFMIGDGEEIITQLMDLYCDWRKSGEPREAFLLRCARTRGLYVPRFYAPSEQFGAVTPLRDDVPKVIDKCMIENLSDASFPDRFFVPFTETVFDRVMLEIARGCTRGCRFCQAGYIYRPVRERSVERLLEQTQSILRATGYEEVSLSSLSSGDYSQLTQLTHELVRRYRDDHVNITLPSLRIDSIVKDALLDVGAVRKSSLTFAPEAGTQRLRDVINKGVTQDDLIRSVGDAFEAGYTNVKLYFMIGLPTETDEDLLGIAQLAKAVRERYYQMPKEQRPAPPRVGASASTFVPKPHTAFQWEPQATLEQILEKQQFLRQAMRIKGVDFNWHEPYTSFMEAAFSRGDRHLCKVLLRAWQRGCKFDGWSEFFHYDAWLAAFADCGIDPADYACRRIDVDAPLPWDHINHGVSKAFLRDEYEKALRGETTGDCRGGCKACGVQKLCKGVCPTCA